MLLNELRSSLYVTPRLNLDGSKRNKKSVFLLHNNTGHLGVVVWIGWLAWILGLSLKQTQSPKCEKAYFATSTKCQPKVLLVVLSVILDERLVILNLGNSTDKLHHPRLMLIQHNKFYWISNRSGVAELIWAVTLIFLAYVVRHSNGQTWIPLMFI